MDLEIQIQNERILSILNETIYKTEIVIFLLLSGGNIEASIGKILSEEQFQMVKKIYDKFETSTKLSDPIYEAVTEDEIQKVF